MNTHIFIVGEQTFPIHLEYMFVGTGAKNKGVDFNNIPTSNLHHSSENGLVAMMADGARLRKDDNVIFYLQAANGIEGKFYGIFKVLADGIFLEKNNEEQYLLPELDKSLIFRQQIYPYEVYSDGVTEWEALDEIKNIPTPSQMLWSLIYRKLKGNRGNTMVTIYEAERLFDLIRRKNNLQRIEGTGFTYDGNSIVLSNFPTKIYEGEKIDINIFPRLKHKYSSYNAHEAHLQMYITQNIGKHTNQSLDEAIGVVNNEIEWLGNEVSCGVGMQRIDIMLSKVISQTERVIMPIELKCTIANDNTVLQLYRYIDWVEQYYTPNRVSTIQPVLICRHQESLTQGVKDSFNIFNQSSINRFLPLLYIQYRIVEENIIFNKIQY